MTTHFVRLVSAAALFALLTTISACGQAGISEVAESLSPEEALTKRVEKRWDAMLAMDMKEVYKFATPAYREAHDLAHLQNQYAAQIDRERIEIHEVKINEDDSATAKVIVLLYFMTDAAPGVPYEGMSRVVETWVKRDGKWWFVEPR